MIKVLFITNSFKDHTPVFELSDLVKGLDKNRFEIHVCCLWKGGPNMEKFRNLGVRVHNFGMKVKANFMVIHKIKRYMLDNHIDILQSTLFPSNFYGRIAALRAKVPCIVSRYISVAEHKESALYWLYVLAESVLDRKSDRIVANANAVKQYLKEKHRLKEEQIVVIHDGIETGKFDVWVEDKRGYRKKLGLNPDILTVCCVARLEPVKGIRYLIEAAKKIIDRGHEVQFLLVGGGSMQDELQKMAKKSGIDDKVIFAGFRSDIPQILSLSDIFIMPSLSEGLCHSVLEAMAAAKPVIATIVGGTADIISNRQIGMLVKPRDCDAIAAALARMLSDEKLRLVIGEKARAHVRENFSHKNMIMNYQRLYEQSLKEKGRYKFQQPRDKSRQKTIVTGGSQA